MNMKWNFVIVPTLFLAVSLTAIFFPPLAAQGADDDYWQDTDNFRLAKTGQVQGSLSQNDDKKVLAYLEKGLRLLKSYGDNPYYRIKFIARLSIWEKLTYPRWRGGNDKKTGVYLSKFTEKLRRLIINDETFTFSGERSGEFIHGPADFNREELENLIADIKNGRIDYTSLDAAQKIDIAYTAEIAREPKGYKGGSCGPPSDKEDMKKIYDKWVAGDEIPTDEQGNGCPLDEERVKHTDWLVKRDGPRTTKKKIVHEQGGKVFAKAGGAGHHDQLENVVGFTVIQAKGRAAFEIYDKRNGYQVNSRVLDYFDPAKVEQVLYQPENVVSGPISGSHYLQRNRQNDACFTSHAIFQQKARNQASWNASRKKLEIAYVPYDPVLWSTVVPKFFSVEVELAKGEKKDTACGGAPGGDGSASSEAKQSGGREVESKQNDNRGVENNPSNNFPRFQNNRREASSDDSGSRNRDSNQKSGPPFFNSSPVKNNDQPGSSVDQQPENSSKRPFDSLLFEIGSFF